METDEGRFDKRLGREMKQWTLWDKVHSVWLGRTLETCSWCSPEFLSGTSINEAEHACKLLITSADACVSPKARIQSGDTLPLWVDSNDCLFKCEATLCWFTRCVGKLEEKSVITYICVEGSRTFWSILNGAGFVPSLHPGDTAVEGARLSREVFGSHEFIYGEV